MAVESCTSCTSSNLATQYAEQLAEGLRSRRSAEDRNLAARNDATAVPNPGQANGPTVNGLGETVGQIINTTA